MNDPLIQRCSGFARAEELGPAGTAGSYRGYVALDVPLPWPSEITAHPEIAPAAAALSAAGVRFQGIVPDPGQGPAARRMVTFLRPGGPFDRYRTVRWTVPAGDVTEALLSVAASAEASGGGDVHAGIAARLAAGDDAGRYVLVCTHGKRDACCGSLGTRLATVLPGLGAGVNVWRTSHTGGHRFAPTALFLPEGTAWAYLDLDRLVGIADRTLDVEEAAGLYRGCTGLDGAEVQAAECAALRTLGWSWLDQRREGHVLERDGGRTRVCLEATAADGARTAFVATVEVARVMPVPDCGKPPEEARKSAPELTVTDFRAA
ncbi:MAG TPA: sucrase ferredoxin [Acidimicrobiales bacterium]|nr:sucrase ferredoxin [Acidimicrobiales bacterium]